MLRIDRRAPRAEERACGDIQHVIRSVAENDLVPLNANAPAKCSLQREAATIGVARHIASRIEHGLPA